MIPAFSALLFSLFQVGMPWPGPGTVHSAGGGGGAAPTLVSYTGTTDWTSNPVANIKTVTVPSFVAGDILVVIALDAGSGTEIFSAPTATGLTFSNVVNHAATSNCAAMLSTATAAGSGTNVVITVNLSSTVHMGFGVWVWRNSTGVGNSASGFSATRTVSLTPTAAHGAIMWGMGDWAAAAVQSFTPTQSNIRVNALDSGEYSVYAADLIDQSGTGAVSYGIGGAGTGPFSIVALEIKHQ